MSGAPKGKVALVECPVCGRTMGNTGLGRHMRAHADAEAAVARREPDGTHTSAEPPAALTRAQSGPDGVTTMEVVMAVLAKVSPDGKVRVTDLPDVIEWAAATDRIVRLVQS